MPFPYPDRQSTVCPACAAEAELRAGLEPPGVYRDGGRIVFDSWEIRKDHEYFFERVAMLFPGQRKPRTLRRELSNRGHVWLTCMPLAVAALGIALFLPIHRVQMTIVAALVAGAAVTRFLVAKGKPEEADERNGLLEDFWDEAAPEFHQRGFQSDKGITTRDVCLYEAYLNRNKQHIGETARQAEWARQHLAAVVEEDKPPYPTFLLVPLKARVLAGQADLAAAILEEVEPCFTGAMPLQYASELLEQFPETNLEKDVRVRLRVLLCGALFDAGWQPRQMHLLGKVFPAIGQAIASENEGGLWNLYTLHKRAKVQDWKMLGDAETVFDLARVGGDRANVLIAEPDLLLVIQRNRKMGGREAHSLLVCEEGLFFDKQLIPDARTKVETKDPSRELARKVEAWKDYYFETFQHYLEYYRKQEPKAYHQFLWKQRLVRCRSCDTTYLGIPGEAGVSVTDV